MVKVSDARPQQPTKRPDETDEKNAEVLRDIRKDTTKKLEADRKEYVEQAPRDGFQAKQQTNAFLRSKDERSQAELSFGEEFSPELVATLERNLKVKINPEQALRAKNAVRQDPAGGQVVALVRQALEARAREAAPEPREESLLRAATEKPETTGAKPREPQTPRVPDPQGREKNAFFKATDKDSGHKPIGGRNAPTVPDKEGKHDKKLADKKDHTAAFRDEGVKEEGDAERRVTKQLDDVQNEAALHAEPPLDPAPLAEGSAALIGEAPAPELKLGDDDDQDDDLEKWPLGLQESEAALGGGNAFDPQTQPLWPSTPSPGDLSRDAQEAARALGPFLQNMGDASVEGALIVLQDAIRDLDKDLATAQKELKLRHKVNDAYRNYCQQFFSKMAKLTDPKQQMEWQRMRFEIGYDSNGNEIVQSVPDVTKQTGEYQHVEGKGASDISPEESFRTAHGDKGYDEAKFYGGFKQIDGEHIEGYTSYWMVSKERSQSERDVMKSKQQELKQEAEKIVLNIQKLMQMKKDMLDEFGKIFNSRAQAWDQIIAMLPK